MTEALEIIIGAHSDLEKFPKELPRDGMQKEREKANSFQNTLTKFDEVLSLAYICCRW